MVKFGFKKDQPSTDDKSFELLKPSLVSASSSDTYIIPTTFPVYDQGSLSSCVANATCFAASVLLENQNKTPNVFLSRLFVYWNARAMSMDTGGDEGSYIRNAFKCLSTLGVCLESEFPYNAAAVFSQPPISCYKTGNDNLISGFYRITSESEEMFNDVEAAIRSGHPVVLGLPVSKSFTQSFDVRESDTLFDAPGDTVGKHAITIVGVRINEKGIKEFKIRNSWGIRWGFSGTAWITCDYLNLGEDLFVPTLIPTLLV